MDEKEKKPIKEYEIYENKSKRLETDIKNLELAKVEMKQKSII